MKSIVAGCDDKYRKIDVAQPLETENCINLQNAIAMFPAGGMSLIGNSGGAGSFGHQSEIYVGKNFSVAMLVTPRWQQCAMQALMWAHDGTNHLILNFGSNFISGAADLPIFLSVSFDNSSGRTQIENRLSGDLVNKPCMIILSVSNGVPSLFFNGTKLNYQTPPATFSELTIYRMFGGIYSGYGQFDGVVHEAKVYSFPITADQARSSFGLPRYIRAGIPVNGASEGGSGWGSCQAYTSSISSVYAACNQGVPGTFGWIFNDDPLQPGDQLVLNFKIASIGSGTWTIQGFSSANNTHEGGNIIGLGTTGVVSWTYTAAVATRALVVMNSQYYAADQHISLEDIHVQVIRKTVHKKVHRRGTTSCAKTIGTAFANAFVCNSFPGDGLSSPSWSGNTLTITADSQYAMVRVKPFHSRPGFLYPGQVVKLHVQSDVDLGTINPLDVTGSRIWSYEGINTARPAGTYTIYIESRLKISFAELCFFIQIINTGTANITFHEVVVEGVLCDWRRDSVVSSGTWVDMSGNCFDLVSTYFSTGTRAVKPVPRVERVFYNGVEWAGISAQQSLNVLLRAAGVSPNVHTEWRTNNTMPDGLIVSSIVPNGLSSYVTVYNSNNIGTQTNGFNLDVIQYLS